MITKSKIMAAGTALMVMTGASVAGAATTPSVMTALGGGGSPAAFCCKAYDSDNSAGLGCAPVAPASANACSGAYIECAGAQFLCGPEPLVDPGSLNTIYGPSCECSTQVQGPKQ
jgi:hypothetical protein